VRVVRHSRRKAEIPSNGTFIANQLTRVRLWVGFAIDVAIIAWIGTGRGEALDLDKSRFQAGIEAEIGRDEQRDRVFRLRVHPRRHPFGRGQFSYNPSLKGCHHSAGQGVDRS